MSRRPVIPVPSGFTETPPWQAQRCQALTWCTGQDREEHNSIGRSLLSPRASLTSPRASAGCSPPAGGCDEPLVFCITCRRPGEVLSSKVSFPKARPCATGQGPGLLLLACPAFQSYFSFLLPLMKSSSLLLLFLAGSECHGMCVADKHGFLLVS